MFLTLKQVKGISIFRNLFNRAMKTCPPNLQSEVINLHCSDMLKKFQEKNLMEFLKYFLSNKYTQLKAYVHG